MYNIMFICIHKSILFSYLLMLFYIYFYYSYCFLKYYCPLAAVANKVPHRLWDNTGKLVLILILIA